MPIQPSPSFVDVVRRHAASHPDALAVAHVGESVAPQDAKPCTYRELDTRALSVARALSRVCRPGDRALLLFPEGIDFAVAFLGCLYANVVAVPSPLPGAYKQQQSRVAAIAADAGPAVVVTAESTRAEVHAFVARGGTARIPVLVLPEAEAEDGADTSQPPRPDSLALLQYTSGSTGSPKGVMLTHSNISENAATLVTTFGMTTDDKFGAWIPHYHDMGLTGLILPAWYAGSSATVMSPTAFIKRPVRWLELVDRHDLVWSAAPDFAYDLCTRTVTEQQLEHLDLSRWRYAANGSEPVQAATLDAFAKRFAPAGLRRETLSPCYGLAEATVFVAGSGNREPVVRRVEEAALAAGRLTDVDAVEPGPETRDLVSCGSPRDLAALVVDPDDGVVLPPGRIGELWLRGACVGTGYWRAPAESDRVFNGTTADGRAGFLRTGDLAVIDDGELYVTGRIKELIIIRGRNIYPQDIEHVVRAEIPELRGLVGAAFGVVTANGEETVAVVHEVRPGVRANRLAEIGAAVRQSVAREIGVTAGAVQLVRRGTVDRTTSGKVQRNAVRAAFLRGATATQLSLVDPAIQLAGPGDAR